MNTRFFYIMFVAVVLLAACGKPAPAAPTAAPATPQVKSLVLDEQWAGDLGQNWLLYHNQDGGVVDMPPENAFVQDGQLSLGIQPDPQFETRENQYNNSFLVSKTTFGPTSTEKVVIEFTYAAPTTYHGSSGLWIETAGTFSNEGKMREKGFEGAFGLSFLSTEEGGTRWLDGLKFASIVGWNPQCTFDVEGVEVSATNLYRIEWTVAGFAAYVNNTLVGTCPALAGLKTGDVQLWSDNSFVPQTVLPYGYLNPPSPQWSTFGSIEIWTEPVQ